MTFSLPHKHDRFMLLKRISVKSIQILIIKLSNIDKYPANYSCIQHEERVTKSPVRTDCPTERYISLNKPKISAVDVE